MRPKVSIAHGIPQFPRQHDPPRLFFFGDTTDLDWCKYQCAMEPQCYAFGLNRGVGASFDKQCYGRGFGAPEIMHDYAKVHSGVKLC